MKHILLAVLVVAMAGCGPRGTARIVEGEANHSMCDHDHAAHDHGGTTHRQGDHDHAVPHEECDHDPTGHDHTGRIEGHSHEGCDHDHTGHTHSPHTDHDHPAVAEGHPHEGCDHDGHTAHDHPAVIHDRSAHAHHNLGVNTDNHSSHSHDHGATTDSHSSHSHGHGTHASHSHDHGASANSHASHSHAHGAGCGGSADDHADDPEDIIFTASQAALTDFEVAPARRGTFSNVIKCSGVISPARGEQVTVVAPVSGIIATGRRSLVEGGAVSAGGSLFSISTAAIEGGDVLTRLRSNLNKAKSDYDRGLRLSEDNIVSQAELDALRAAWEVALAEYESLSGGTAGVSVTSPIAGYVFGLSVTPGDYVEKGQPLMSVVRNNRLELRADVSQRHAGQLHGVASANFRVPSSGKVYNIRELDGNVVSVGRAVGAGSALIPVTFSFRYEEGIVPGSFAEVNLLGASREGVLTLPLSAVTEQQGLYYVYVRTGGDVYRRREVKLGGDDGRRVEILSGLAEGEEVVVRGAVNVRMAAASGAIPHGHSH